MSKQTAVEWMVEQVELISNNKNVSKEEMVKLYDEVIERAKKMELEQIVDAWEDGIDSFSTRTAEQYYTEQYGGSK